MKHTTESLTKLAKTAGGLTPGVTAGGQGLIGELNRLVNNGRELLKLYQNIQAGQPTGPPAIPEPDLPAGPPGRALKPANSPASLPAKEPPGPPSDPRLVIKGLAATVLDMAADNGLSDKTVSELLELAGPFTVKQLRGLIK